MIDCSADRTKRTREEASVTDGLGTDYFSGLRTDSIQLETSSDVSSRDEMV